MAMVRYQGFHRTKKGPAAITIQWVYSARRVSAA